MILLNTLYSCYVAILTGPGVVYGGGGDGDGIVVVGGVYLL